MVKIEKKASRAVCFTKRRSGLYSKASELCLLSGAQMAILTTPPSSESNVSFYSFGHSSVDGVVDSFLKDQRPVREDIVGYASREEDLGFLWEDESLAKSENAEELSGAIDSISRMLRDLKELRFNNQDDVKKKEIKKRNLVLHETQKLDQTLNLQSSFGNFGIADDRFKTDTEMVGFDDQVLMISENTDNPKRKLDDRYNNQEELDLDQLIDFGSLFDEDFATSQELTETAETSLLMSSEMENVSMVTTNPNLCSDCEAVEDGASQRFR